MNMTFDALVENFDFLEDWEERYKYVIELGKEMPMLDPALKTDGTKVDGCVSQVWLQPRTQTDKEGQVRLFFEGDSDAHIVRGLIAILRVLYNGIRIEDAVTLDALGALERLDLSSHISPQRSNGLTAMIHRLRQFSQNMAVYP